MYKKDIEDLLEVLSQLGKDYRERAKAAAISETQYKKAYKEKFLEAKDNPELKNLDQRESWTHLQVQQEFYDNTVAQARLDAQKQVIGIEKARLNGLQTLASLSKEEKK